MHLKFVHSGHQTIALQHDTLFTIPANSFLKVDDSFIDLANGSINEVRFCRLPSAIHIAVRITKNDACYIGTFVATPGVVNQLDRPAASHKTRKRSSDYL